MSIIQKTNGFYTEDFEDFVDKDIKPILNELERTMKNWLGEADGRDVQAAWIEIEDLVTVRREDAWLTAAWGTKS